MQSRNPRLGLKLYTVYLVLYGGFVGINTFSTSTMEMKPFAGINLAIWYGFLLIVAAFALALLYGMLCDSHNDAPESASSETELTSESEQEGSQD